MFNSLVDLVTGSAWAYGIVFGVAALDAVFPLVPSETVVVTAGALAAAGRLSVPAVLAAAAAGAFTGDNACYALGRLATPLLDRFARTPKARDRLDRAKRALARRAPTVIVVSRFIPGGRTATMLASGATRFPWRRFAPLDAFAAAVWASYATALGYAGGMTFRDRPLFAVAVAIGLAIVLALLLELARRSLARLRRRSHP